MNKGQYSTILERKIYRDYQANHDKLVNSKEYKDLSKKIIILERRIKKLRTQQDKITPKYYNYNDRQKVIKRFEDEWDDMLLVAEKKRRDATKIKLLKKYNLYK